MTCKRQSSHTKDTIPLNVSKCRTWLCRLYRCNFANSHSRVSFRQCGYTDRTKDSTSPSTVPAYPILPVNYKEILGDHWGECRWQALIRDIFVSWSRKWGTVTEPARDEARLEQTWTWMVGDGSPGLRGWLMGQSCHRVMVTLLLTQRKAWWTQHVGLPSARGRRDYQVGLGESKHRPHWLDIHGQAGLVEGPTRVWMLFATVTGQVLKRRRHICTHTHTRTCECVPLRWQWSPQANTWEDWPFSTSFISEVRDCSLSPCLFSVSTQFLIS